MDFRFCLINERTGVQIEIEEPVNFDNFKPILRRDTKSHGVSFEFAEQNLGFYGNAYKFVTEEYNLNGVDGVLVFLVEYNCNGEWQEFYKGALDYKRYEEVIGDYRIVNVGIAQLGVLMTLKNRMETKVNLDTLRGFEGATLPAYTNLGKEISIPSKTVLLTNNAAIAYGTGGQINMANKIYKIPFGDIISDEIDDFSPENSFRELGQIYESPVFENNIEKVIATNYSISTKFGFLFMGGITNTTINCRVQYLIYNKANEIVQTLYDNPFQVNMQLVSGIYTGYINDVILSFDNVEIPTGYKLCATMTFSSSFSSHPTTANSSSYITLKTNSKTTSTKAKTFAIHESFSRIAESITDNSLTAKSNYYGRTDSEVNPTQIDGVGSLRCLTNGYLLRNATMQDGSKPEMSVSLKDLLDGLNAIDAIGYSIEGDKLRIEPWEYFYTNDVILRCTGINEVKRKIDPERCFSLFNVGYDKWEAEEWNGIDGFHGKRQYRTKLKNIDTKLEQFCKLIADSYAIESTRRKGISEPSKDWRFDNNIFVIDLIRKNGNIVINTGSGDAGTLIDPGTVFNVDLSPARMAARWFGYVMQAMSVTDYFSKEKTYNIDSNKCINCGSCYSTYPDAFIEGDMSALFKNGTTEITPLDIFIEQDIQAGLELCPYSAIGFIEEIVGVVSFIDKLMFAGAEGYTGAKTISTKGNVVITKALKEDQNLSADIMSKIPIPKFKPELVEFEYPLTAAEFMAIRNNPNGLIEFDGEYGWIKEIEADLLEGTAKFTLIKKRDYVTKSEYTILQFTESISWIVPENVTAITVFAVGGGGGGGGDAYQSGNPGSGGNGGQVIIEMVAVIPGTIINITIGNGGNGGTGAKNVSDATNGGNTTFGSLVTALGGEHGRNSSEGQQPIIENSARGGFAGGNKGNDGIECPFYVNSTEKYGASGGGGSNSYGGNTTIASGGNTGGGNGGGGNNNSTTNNGGNGAFYGAAGGGAAFSSGHVGNGGNGHKGIIIIMY